MSNNELIHVISDIIANKLYRNHEVLRQIEDDKVLKLTVYETARNGNVNGCLQCGDNIFSFRSTASQN